MACTRKFSTLRFKNVDADANGGRSYVGYAHMGRIWYEAVRAVSRKELVTPPVTVEK